MTADPLKALFHPFEAQLLPLPQQSDIRILFVNGRACEGLSTLPRAQVTVQQYFKPWADEAARAGYRTAPEMPDDSFDVILLHAPRQHDEALHAIGESLLRLKDGGLFLCAAANDAGGKRLKKDMRALSVDAAQESKHKSRVLWATVTDADRERWLAAAAGGGYRKVCGGRFVSRPGVFSWDEVDPGSAMLAENLPPETLSRRGADFGCGFGFLSIHALAHNPAITEIFCIDADARAVESCRRNLGDDARARFIWEDLTRGNRNLPSNLDWIVMNPPFHEGARTVPEAGAAFIATARECLRPDGQLWMVANAHLPYEKTLSEKFTAVRKICERHGYKIFHAT